MQCVCVCFWIHCVSPGSGEQNNINPDPGLLHIQLKQRKFSNKHSNLFEIKHKLPDSSFFVVVVILTAVWSLSDFGKVNK